MTWAQAQAEARRHRFRLCKTDGEYRVCLDEDDEWDTSYCDTLDAAVYRGRCKRENRDVYGR